MSDGSRIIHRFVEEGTYGTTPVDSTAWYEFPFSDASSLTASPQTAEANVTRSDRLPAAQHLVGMQVGGSNPITMQAKTYDELLAAVLGSSWAADSVSIGTTKRSFSYEVEFADIAKYILYTGMRVGQFDLNFAYGQLITGSVQFAGNGVDVTPVASAVGAGSVNAPYATTHMAATTALSSIKLGGVEIAGYHVSNLTTSITANLRAVEALKSLTAVDQGYGDTGISGTFNAFVAAGSWDLLEYVVNSTATSLEYTFGDGTNSYTFLYPSVKFSGNLPAGPGRQADAVANLTYNASGGGCTVTRVQP